MLREPIADGHGRFCGDSLSAVRFIGRRGAVSAKEAALAEARKATARARRENEKAERYRANKQGQPADRMTTNQWIGS